MGLFGAGQGKTDTTDTRNLAEVFPPGVPFRLVELLGLGMSDERLLGKIKVTPVTEPETVLEFGVWGSLSQQLTQLEAGELPAIVTLSNVTGEWLFSPHGPEPVTVVNEETGATEEVPQRVNVEAHMVPDAATDSALGFVSDRQVSAVPEVPDGGHKPPVPVEPPSVHPTDIDESQTFQPNAS